MPFDGVDLPGLGILGAGISGIASVLTFQKLAQEAELPLPPTTIAEADSKPGGRAKSFMLDGVAVDKGAHWFHRGNSNRFFKFVSEVLGLPESDFALDTLNSVSFIESRARLVDSFRASALEILDAAYQDFKIKNPSDDISLYDLAQYTGDPRVMRECELSLGCTWAGVMPDQVSYHEIDRDPAVSGGLQYKPGVGELMHRLADRAEKFGATIKYDCPVDKITQDEMGSYFSSSDRHRLDFALAGITASVGVLKASPDEGGIQFEPRPSKMVRKALKGMQMGHMCKIAAVFDEVYLKLKGQEEPRVQQDGRLYFRLDSVALEVGGLKGFIHVRSGGSPIVMIYLGGPASIWMESNPNRVNEIVEKVFKHSGIFSDYKSHLRGVSLGGFNLDPNARGAYSAALPHHKRFKPIADGRIIYFGEAFAKAKKSAGTMEAAYWSGERAGKMLFEQWRLLLPERKPKIYYQMFREQSVRLAA